MRGLTPEEAKANEESLNKLFTPTGRSFFDYDIKDVIDEDDSDEIYQVTQEGGVISSISVPTLNVYDVQYHLNTAAPWISTEVFLQGCYKNCAGCFNQEIRKLDTKKHILTVTELMDDLVLNVPYKCVTFSGGEPMLQSGALAALTSELKRKGFTIVCYTGYQADELPFIFPESSRVFENIDILIDGMFIAELRKPGYYGYNYVGSSNQRVIDMQASLKAKQCILWDTEKSRRIEMKPEMQEFFARMKKTT